MESLELAKNTVVGLLKAGCKAEEFVGTALKSSGISLQQFNVLRILRGRKGIPANLQTVQKRMIHKMSNTTRLVDKLIVKEVGGPKNSVKKTEGKLKSPLPTRAWRFSVNSIPKSKKQRPSYCNR